MNRLLTHGYTYDDVSLIPAYVDFGRDEISLHTRLSRRVELDIPIVSSPMDTVTGSRMASEIGRLGGLGFIHRNQSVEDQADQVAKVVSDGYRVGAAVGTQPVEITRADRLVDAGVTVLLVDTAHGDSHYMLDTIQALKRRHPGIDTIAGNIATSQAANRLRRAGADGLRVGVGPGAICTTRIISGMGVPQVSALQNVARMGRWARWNRLPAIADGGINHSGDLTKALKFASTVMLGRLLAGTAESPTDIVELSAEEMPSRFKSIRDPESVTKKFKTYRGMGSPGAMKDGKERKAGGEFHGKDFATDKLVAEGVEGLVPYAGDLQDVIDKLREGLISGMHNTGCRTIADLQRKGKFYVNTHASIMESHPHDLLVTNDGGNYKL